MRQIVTALLVLFWLGVGSSALFGLKGCAAGSLLLVVGCALAAGARDAREAELQAEHYSDTVGAGR